jgi:KipI family sensor histidine kinase inhibitor
MHLVPVGRHAALAEVADAGAALALATWARARLVATDVVPAARTVLFDGVDLTVLERLLATWSPTSDVPSGELVEVPVVYDGPDLAPLAESLGLTVDELVARHTGAEHRVEFCGFTPGFAYVAGSPFDVPRLATPRPRVPAGSVALAGPWTGIYPTATPGGWQLVGRTDVVLWDQARDVPALLPPGARVSFVAV